MSAEVAKEAKISRSNPGKISSLWEIKTVSKGSLSYNRGCNILVRPRSEKIYASSCSVIPGGVNSPVRCFPGLDLSPLIAKSGCEDLLIDADEYRYIDFCCSWGALILGHAYPKIVQAVQEQVLSGSSFGVTTEIEEKLARQVLKHSCQEKIRFVSSGTEATLTALRLARGVTKRDLIVKFTGCYHGHHDALLVQAGSGAASINLSLSSSGIPKDVVQHTICLPFNDSEKLRSTFEAYGNKIAAVILEPVAGNIGVVPGKKEFLQTIRKETRKAGALLVMDEVITGYRVGLKGAVACYQVDSDLSTYGKVIGGGFPAAAVAGKGDIMDRLAPLGEVYQAGTLSGNPIAMRAGYETLLELEKPGFYAELEEKTEKFVSPIDQALKQRKKGCVQRVGSMFSLFFGHEKVEEKPVLDQKLFKKFFRFLFHRGIYIPPSPYESWFLMKAHKQDHLQKAQKEILEFVHHHL